MQKQYRLGPMTWKVTQRNVWKDMRTCELKRLNNYIKSRRMDDHQFSEAENETVGELSTVCSQMSSNVCIWLVLWDLSFVVCEQACSCGHNVDEIL